MNFTRVTIAGAGLAGLSAAVGLVEAGKAVTIADAAPHAGGRCRSYHDRALDLVIDNGNHLVLAGNAAVARFRATIGATAPLAGPDHADFEFCDLAGVGDAAHWRVRINDSAVPWWLALPGRRVPGATLRQHLALAKLARAPRDDITIDRHLGPARSAAGPVWSRLIEPVLLAALNTAPLDGSARLAASVIGESLGRGGHAVRPRIAIPGLSAAFIDPAIDWLSARGAGWQGGRRLRGIVLGDDWVRGLDWGDGVEPIEPHDAVVLAVPPWVAADLVPGLDVPDEHRAIVNGHFAVAGLGSAGRTPRMIGLFGGTAEWLFVFDDRVSVTVSAAEAIVDLDRETLAQRFWADIGIALAIVAPMPAWQVVKERRATFAATPRQNARRPAAATRWRNLFLAGDWTATGLPATIEGALRSGETAARLVARAR